MKTKRTVFSMVMFLSVFWFSVLFDIKNPTTSSLEEGTGNNDTGSITTQVGEDSQAVAIAKNGSQENGTVISKSLLSDPLDENILVDNDNPKTEIKNKKTEDLPLENATTDVVTGTIDVATFNISAMDAQEARSNIKAFEATADSSEFNIEEEPIQEVSRYANIGISIAKSYVNIRSKANTQSDVLGKLYRNSAAQILDTIGDWYYVESGSVKGYISSDYIKTGIPDEELIDKYGKLRIEVSVDGLNVREHPDLESKKLTVIYQNEKYNVIDLQDEWLKVDIDDDKVIGYVRREYVELLVDFEDAISKEEELELLKLKEEERIKRETAVKYRDEVDYTNSDLKLLACLVHAEAGNQRYEGKLAVANVVLNRIKSGKYPNNLKDVIYQPGQFSVAKSGSLAKQLDNYDNYTSKSQQLSIKAAKAALAGANNIGTRLYFHTYKSAVRKGYDQKKNSVKLQDHLFW
ncbi:cell wall hydrolase [Mobilitalea sibirica]|uniref:Cell wall hydrolase n=1 Tax=Mobilitalea sibirica TaxID=1462919 RepID=A0A8J7L318_9FIRM|nr:cell wall hydrolase [Mobilitalea sibirica]MBH1941618.1 cell wall hydrolase [Mobilitalea sibirica]